MYRIWKIFFTLLFIIAVQLTSSAQTEKGRWTAGVSVGSLSYQSQNELDHSFSMNLNPSAGRFIVPNLLVGLGIPVNISSSKYSTSTNSNFTYGLSPFTRYYKGNSAVKSFIGLSLSYLHANLRNENSPNIISTTKSNTIKVAPSVGLAYFINRDISLDGEIAYNLSKSSVSGSNSTNPYNYTNKNITLTCSFYIFFDR